MYVSLLRFVFLPYFGLYLTMIYLGLIAPFLFHRVMAKKLIEWDQKYASAPERELAKKQNKNSGIPLLINSL